ncbi:MAG: vitamin K epoxide reductase family protein [Hymenobacteraceae bacterium]|nr:vitamin K epoxide reductase family protein [Hymenobacteraceae bacterium]MDX5397948.1 vitamin K epoxide reductase family protein [Hymenobacteraceae bacterium]MDX5514020.1 vitamin K epoxide reductase family protein [Hymenobacteraceae bacterium]
MESTFSLIDQIRNDKSEATRNRRKIAALAVLGLIDFGLISLFQMGAIKKLPDLPGKVFDTEKVNTDGKAVLLGMPDGVVSLGGYAATVVFAMAATRFKKQSRWIDLALGAVVAGQAAGAAQYLVNMATVQKKACIYCIGGAAVNFAALKPMYELLRQSK